MALDSLLRAVWLVWTLPIVAALIPSSKTDAFRHYAFQLLGRGKIMDASSRKLSVPQKYFLHFYAVGFLWNSFILAATWLYAYKITSTVSESYKYGIWRSVVLLLLFEAQVLRRLFESIYVFNYSPSARLHIASYLTGLSFYVVAPPSFCGLYSMEVFKYVVDLFVEGKDSMQTTAFDLWVPLLQLKWYTWIGTVLFFWGWVHQRRCHAILGSLRKNGGKKDDYAIPEGDLFEYVSSAHYLAEIVMYGGLLTASGFTDITIWLIFAFVVANLTFSAGETHRWYLRKFDNYPRHRCAIIPFVY